MSEDSSTCSSTADSDYSSSCEQSNSSTDEDSSTRTTDESVSSSLEESSSDEIDYQQYLQSLAAISRELSNPSPTNTTKTTISATISQIQEKSKEKKDISHKMGKLVQDTPKNEAVPHSNVEKKSVSSPPKPDEVKNIRYLSNPFDAAKTLTQKINVPNFSLRAESTELSALPKNELRSLYEKQQAEKLKSLPTEKEKEKEREKEKDNPVSKTKENTKLSAFELRKGWIDLDTLPHHELRTLYEKQNESFKAIRAENERLQQSSTVIAKDTIVNSSALSTSQMNILMENCKKNNLFAQPKTELIEPTLVDVNILPFEMQQSILANVAKQKELASLSSSKQTKMSSFTNDSVISAKKEYETLNSGKLMNSSINSLFHGNSPQLGLVIEDFGLRMFNIEEFIGYLKRKYPDFSNFLDSTEKTRDILSSLVTSHKKLNYIVVIPTKCMLEMYRKIMNPELVGYYIIILKDEENIPEDNVLYSCATTLSDLRINVRRIDASTIVIDNYLVAVLDTDSRGRIYVPKEMNGSPVVTETDPVEEEEEEKKNTGLPGGVRTIGELPEYDSTDLDLVEIKEKDFQQEGYNAEEEEDKTNGTESHFMLAVSNVTKFRNKKMEYITCKMMSKGYNGKVDMRSFINESAHLSLSSNVADTATTNSSQNKSKLFLKVFRYDDLHERVKDVKVRKTESLTPCGQYEFSDTVNYDLDQETQMTEYVLGETCIKKSTLLNHLCVLAFKKSDGNYVTTSFSIPNDNSGLSVYKSVNENVILRFKDNTLSSIVVNQESKHNLNSPHCAKHYDNELEMVKNISARVHFKNDYKSFFSTELNLTQFVNAALPLSRPSIIDFFKTGGAALFKTALKLKKRNKSIKLSDYTKSGTTSSEKRAVGIGANSFEVSKKTHSHHFQKTVLNSKTSKKTYLVRYHSLPERNEKYPISFSDMINDNGKANIMSIVLDDPYTGKRKTLIFILENTKKVNPNTWYVTEKDDISYYFELDENTEVVNIFIKFVSRKRPSYVSFPATSLSTRKETEGPLIPTYTHSKGFETNASLFLSQETLNRVTPKITHKKYVADRIRTMLTGWITNSGDLCSKTKASSFFTELQQQIDEFMTNQSVPVDLTKKDLTREDVADAIKFDHAKPKVETIHFFDTMMCSGFPIVEMADSLPNAKRLFNLLLNEYKNYIVQHPEKELFEAYINMLRFIVNEIVVFLKK